jgi:protocatechuate 3,4-dioxygenase beta subunit
MITASQPQYPSLLLRCCSTRGSYVFSEVLPLTRSNKAMMSRMRIIAATILSIFIAGCAGTTANSPTATPLASSTGTATTAPASSPSATQATTNALACTAPAAALVELTEGPYYTANPPQNATLRTAGVAGTALTLTGYVVSTSCQPIANAKLDFWQADGNGNYDNSGYTLRGWQLTDANGAYRLETVIPGLYPGRTEHIHFKVTVNGKTYTSQLFFPGVSQNSSDSIYSSRMLVTLNTTTSPVTGTYTFVVNVP